MGGSTSQGANQWPTPRGPLSAGYVKQKRSSRKGASVDEIGLRSDIGKNNGVTTIINSTGEKGLEHGGSEANCYREGRGQWNTSASRLTEVSSDDEGRETGRLSWRTGIKTTTISTQVV